MMEIKYWIELNWPVMPVILTILDHFIQFKPILNPFIKFKPILDHCRPFWRGTLSKMTGNFKALGTLMKCLCVLFMLNQYVNNNSNFKNFFPFKFWEFWCVMAKARIRRRTLRQLPPWSLTLPWWPPSKSTFYLIGLVVSWKGVPLKYSMRA